ncbi:MAG: hypothetical protein BWZ02_01943 [Lentisphaerae bacterium ADurb.BinA184]|nr:MAG: hypothetical protein BWZ02_01943 [Lentisphaerae bacterium ADurb.BinA184]
MTRRAILLGLVGAALVCAFTYFNDAVMRQTYLVGNNLPISVYGVLLVVVLVVNPLTFRLCRRRALSGAEIATALALTLAACSIPSSGLMRTFTASLVMPHHWQRTTPSWQEHEALQRLPGYMLTTVTPATESDVVNGFVQGKSVGNRRISPADVPWAAWVRPLLFWVPLIVVLWVGLLGLSLVVHRQWADHEQLPYPIATFADSLLPGAEGGPMAEGLRSRLFWGGMLVVLAIHLNNYASVWFPANTIPVRRQLDLAPLQVLFPTLTKGGAWFAFRPTLWFTVIAFAYFLASDVSLALGIGPYVWCFISGMLSTYGISAVGAHPNITDFVQFGAYAAMLGVLLYTGRRFYAQTARAAVGLRTTDPPDRNSVLGARVFLVSMLVFILYLAIPGRLDWQLAVIFAAFTVLMFLIMSRVVVETGVFFIQAYFWPSAVIIGLLGTAAVGPRAALVMAVMTGVLMVDPREAFMPFMINSLKLLDRRGVDVGRAARWAVAAVVIGLLAAIPVTLYLQYDRGANMSDSWATYWVPRMPFDQVVQLEQRLDAQGKLAAAQAVSGWGHFRGLQAQPAHLLALAAGAGLLTAFTIGRLRFSRWPLHPVMFLIWATYPASQFCGSFLIGWLIKVLVTHYGGSTTYRKLKPLMFGMIAGEMVGGLLIIVIGAVYYAATGQPPKQFWIMPG